MCLSHQQQSAIEDTAPQVQASPGNLTGIGKCEQYTKLTVQCLDSKVRFNIASFVSVSGMLGMYIHNMSTYFMAVFFLSDDK